ncbi:MAG: manganese efflux pump MntP family protein [Clostridia bacterium]
MTLTELFIIAVGLSCDAFAAAICRGLSIKKVSFKNALVVGLYFGGFQAAMPLIGYLIGTGFSDLVNRLDHWIALVLLVFIGGKMIFDSFKKEEECKCDTAPLGISKMLPLAVATSIDALAVGVTFAFLKVEILPAVAFIGSVTLILSMIGVKIGNMFGMKYKRKAEFAGGLILVLMGIKILINHLGIINF